MTGIAPLLGMIGLACAIVIGIGLWPRKRLQRASPDSQALARLAPTGAFLDRPYGVAAAPGIAAAAFAAFANILARFGHPMARGRSAPASRES